MHNSPKIIYTSQLDPTFQVSVEPGSKSERDFIVKSTPWPLAKRAPTHLDWVSLILEQSQLLASEVVSILTRAAEFSYKNGKIDVVGTGVLPKASKNALTLWEKSPIKGKEVFLRDKSGILVPVDGFIIVTTLIFVQEVNNYGERAFLHLILTHHMKRFFLEEKLHARTKIREEVLMLADTETWCVEEKKREALKLRQKLISRYLSHLVKPY